MKIDVDQDMLDDYIAEELRWHYDTLKNDFLSGNGNSMYTHDREIDSELCFNLIQALRLVHNYMCNPSDKITWK